MKKYFLSLLSLAATLHVMAQHEDSTWVVNNYTKIERQITYEGWY